MKKTTSVLIASWFFASFAQANLVSIGAESLHVPLGFDGNDESEVEVIVELPDTCHRRPFGDVKIEGNEIAIDMKAEKVSPSEGVFCIKAIVPYLVSVPVGRLNEGVYHVVVNNFQNTQKNANLVISTPNTDSIDNYTYANVISVRNNDAGSGVLLEGYHPSSCMDLDRVELIPNESGDTIAVLPIIKQTHAICDQMIKPFSYELTMLNTVSSDVVLHVRKIDGRALNFRLHK